MQAFQPCLCKKNPIIFSLPELFQTGVHISPDGNAGSLWKQPFHLYHPAGTARADSGPLEKPLPFSGDQAIPLIPGLWNPCNEGSLCQSIGQILAGMNGNVRPAGDHLSFHFPHEQPFAADLTKRTDTVFISPGRYHPNLRIYALLFQ